MPRLVEKSALVQLRPALDPPIWTLVEYEARLLNRREISSKDGGIHGKLFLLKSLNSMEYSGHLRILRILVTRNDLQD